MKLAKLTLSLLATLALATPFAASAAPAGHALIYISPGQYKHEIRLWQFYYDYWYSQGKAVEPLALETIKPMFADTAMCEDNRAADAIIWVKPRMFYNPHLGMYYGAVIADAYSGSGKFIASYRADVEHSGFLDVQPATQISAIYRTALQEVVGKMQANPELASLATQGLPSNETAMPCGMVAVLPAK